MIHHDLNNNPPSLLQGATHLNSQPVWLLGTWYGVKDHDKDNAALAPQARSCVCVCGAGW